MQKRKIYISNNQSRKFADIHKTVYTDFLNKYEGISRFKINDEGVIVDTISDSALLYKDRRSKENYNVGLWDVEDVIRQMVDTAFASNSLDYKSDPVSVSTHITWKELPEDIKDIISFNKPKRGKILSEDLFEFFVHLMQSIDIQSIARLTLNDVGHYNKRISIVRGTGQETEVNMFYEYGWDCYNFSTDVKSEDCMGWYKKIFDSNNTQEQAIREIIYGR